MLNHCKIEEIKQRLDNTSPGPWKIESYDPRAKKTPLTLVGKGCQILELEKQVDFFRTQLEKAN